MSFGGRPDPGEESGLAKDLKRMRTFRLEEPMYGATILKGPSIFFDLDGVLANFDKRAMEVLGTDNIYRWQFVYGEEAFWNALNSTDYFFRGMELMPGAYRLLQATVNHRRGIITALPKTNSDNVAKQKREWVRENIGNMLVITCPTKDKPKFCNPGNVLIDDRAVNKAAWEAAGGRFIIHTDAQSTIEQLKSMGFNDQAA